MGDGDTGSIHVRIAAAFGTMNVGHILTRFGFMARIHFEGMYMATFNHSWRTCIFLSGSGDANARHNLVDFVRA